MKKLSHHADDQEVPDIDAESDFGEDALEYQITRTEGDYHDLKIREEAIAGRADEPGIEEEDKA